MRHMAGAVMLHRNTPNNSNIDRREQDVATCTLGLEQVRRRIDVAATWVEIQRDRID